MKIQEIEFPREDEVKYTIPKNSCVIYISIVSSLNGQSD